jgi:hypothetical protein
MNSKQVPAALLIPRHTGRDACGPNTGLRSRLQFEQDLGPHPVPGGAIVLVAGACRPFFVITGVLGAFLLLTKSRMPISLPRRVAFTSPRLLRAARAWIARRPVNAALYGVWVWRWVIRWR